MFKLSREDHNRPDFARLREMRSNLKTFLNTRFDFNNAEWNDQLEHIVNHQSGDGSFRIIDSFQIENDAVVDFCNYPTVLCNAILMKSILLCPEKYERLLPSLSRGLDASVEMGICGGGYDHMSVQFDFFEIYFRAGLVFYLERYPAVSAQFTEAINKIRNLYADCIATDSFRFDFDENYEAQIKDSFAGITRKPVFAYGTLMKSESNHHYMDNQMFVEPSEIRGFNLYNLGHFPGIRPSRFVERIVKGEVFLVDDNAMAVINELEGEGSLYLMKLVEAFSDDSCRVVAAYVYNHKARRETRIESGDWRNKG